MRNRPTPIGQTPIEQTAMCGAQHEKAVTKKEVEAEGKGQTHTKIVAIGSTGCANDQLGTSSHVRSHEHLASAIASSPLFRSLLNNLLRFLF